MRFGHAGKFGAHRLALGHVDADAGAAARGRPIGHLQDAPCPGDDHRQPRLVGSACRMRIKRAVARARIEDFEAARDRIRAIARLDGARVGGVDPSESAVAVASPNRRRECFQKLRHRVDVAAQLLMTGGELGQLALRAGQIPDAEHRAPADRAALGQHVAALQRRERARKALALGAQRVHRLFHRVRLFRLQPSAERERTARQRRAQQDRDIAGDFRLVGACGPDHDHLGLGEQQRIGAVALLAQFIDFRMAGGEPVCGARACAQQRDRGRHAKQDDTERERQRGEFMPLKRCECIEIVGKRMQHAALCPGRIGQKGRQSRAALGESPATRMRFAAPSPDRVRHSRALAERSPAGTRPR